MATVGKILNELNASRRCGEISAGIITELRGLLAEERRKAKNAKRRARRQRAKLRDKLATEVMRTDQLHDDYRDLYYENRRLRETIEQERVAVEEAAKKVEDIKRAHTEDVNTLYDFIQALQAQLRSAEAAAEAAQQVQGDRIPGWGGEPF